MLLVKETGKEAAFLLHAEIFHVALRRNGIAADEAVMIGDSYSSDIAGAKAAGIDQIWIHGDETQETATYIVPKLTDVMNIL